MEINENDILADNSIQAQKVESLISVDEPIKKNESSSLPDTPNNSKTFSNDQDIFDDKKQYDLSSEKLKKTSSLSQDFSQLSLRVVDEMANNVQTTLDDNMKTLQKKFEGDAEYEMKDFSIQELSNSLLEKERMLSKADEIVNRLNHDGKLCKKVLNSDKQSAEPLNWELKEEIAKMKEDIYVYKKQLEMLRPDTDAILSLCNNVKIDPALAAPQHLLVLLKSAQENNANLQIENQELKEKLFYTNETLIQNRELTLELNQKLEGIELEDDKRFESKVSEICQYYSSTLNRIKKKLEEKAVDLEEDFWVPRSETLAERLQEIEKHQSDVAIEELRRDLSNAGTDKFSDDDELIIPIGGRHMSVVKPTQVYFEDDDHENPSNTEANSSNLNSPNVSNGAKTCVLQ